MRARAGFSLLELLVVMLILSLLSVGFSRLISSQTLAYIERSRQQDVSASARLALEIIVREVREALPNSIRVIGSSGSAQCLEFMPIVAGSYYLRPVAGLSISSLNLVDFNYANDGSFLSIYPVATADLYAASSGSLALLSSVAATVDAGANDKTRAVTLTAPASFAQDSPRRRAYLVGNPVSFCLNAAGQLRRHQNYGRLVSQSLSPNSGSLLSENLKLNLTVFTYLPASLQRNALVRIELAWAWVDTDFGLKHSLQLRNLP